MVGVMMVLIYAVIFATMATSHLDQNINTDVARHQADVVNMQFYQVAAVDYAEYNPAAVGIIPPAVIIASLPTWFVNKGWTAEIISGTPRTLYVWGNLNNTAPGAGGGRYEMAVAGKGNVLYGFKNASGQFESAQSGVMPGFVLPAGVPTGALVIRKTLN